MSESIKIVDDLAEYNTRYALLPDNRMWDTICKINIKKARKYSRMWTDDPSYISLWCDIVLAVREVLDED